MRESKMRCLTNGLGLSAAACICKTCCASSLSSILILTFSDEEADM